MTHLGNMARSKGETVSHILRIAIRDIVMSDPGEEEYLLGTCVVNGVNHHAEFIRVHDVLDEDGRTVQEPVNDPHGRYDDWQNYYDGHYQTMKVPGFEGDWAMVIFPYA